MNAAVYSFERIEKKYLITRAQYDAVFPLLRARMDAEKFGLHSICNIYFDTENYDLIRISLEKPEYKEKFRLRGYGVPKDDDEIFAEIKKKYDGVVYKRRVCAKAGDMDAFLAGGFAEGQDPQIQREIAWFWRKWRPAPKAAIIYERVALLGRDDPGLRITFDHDVRWRGERLDLRLGKDGENVLPDGKIVMEVKFPLAAPLWLSSLLSEYKIFPSSFSKYGACFERFIAPNLRERMTVSC